MASKMAARNKCKGVLYMICCTDLMYFIHHINDIYFCCICLNFIKIPLNVVSMERSRSNSRSNTKNSAKKANCHIIFCYFTKFYKNEKHYYTPK